MSLIKHYSPTRNKQIVKMKSNAIFENESNSIFQEKSNLLFQEELNIIKSNQILQLCIFLTKISLQHIKGF